MNSEETPAAPPVEIDPQQLSNEALLGVIDNFITREGTDYGVNEVSYDSKVQSIRRQLERGDVKIVFDPTSESVTLMTKSEWRKAVQN